MTAADSEDSEHPQPATDRGFGHMPAIPDTHGGQVWLDPYNPEG